MNKIKQHKHSRNISLGRTKTLNTISFLKLPFNTSYKFHIFKTTNFSKNKLSLKQIINSNLQKYNINKNQLGIIKINDLIDSKNCNLVAIFKDYLISDYIDEFLRRFYKKKESKNRIPKFSDYYKNYLLFFCKPTFSDFFANEIIQSYGEAKAEIYYNKNYRNKNKEKKKIITSKTKSNLSNIQNKISHHITVKSNELLNKKKLNLDNNLSNGNNKINGENAKEKIILKKENTARNNLDLNKINSYKYKASQYSTFKINNSNNKLNTARFINLDKRITNKSSEKKSNGNHILNSPRIINSKRLLLKSDLREKIMKDDNKRPLTMRESLNNKTINNKVIEILTNKINQIKEYIKESDKKNKNSISHIFMKKKVGRKKVLKDNDDIIGMKYGLTERVRNYKLSLNNEISDKKKKIEKHEEQLKNNKNIIKLDKNPIKNSDKSKKTNTSQNKKINKTSKNNKIKNIRNKNNINNGNNYFSDTNYNINFNNCHFHSENRSELYQNIENNTNINNNDNISINNNTELTKENKSIILINNNVKIGSLKVFPIKQMNQNKIIVKGIKINGFEKLVTKKYATRNIDIPKAVTDRIKNFNGNTSQNSSNRYINTSNNNRKNLAKNKKINTNFFKNV